MVNTNKYFPDYFELKSKRGVVDIRTDLLPYYIKYVVVPLINKSPQTEHIDELKQLFSNYLLNQNSLSKDEIDEICFLSIEVLMVGVESEMELNSENMGTWNKKTYQYIENIVKSKMNELSKNTKDQ